MGGVPLIALALLMMFPRARLWPRRLDGLHRPRRLLGDAIIPLRCAVGDVWVGTSRGAERWVGRRWASFAAGNGAQEAT